MDYSAILQSIEAWPLAVAIREGDVLFPWIECVHVLAITLMVGMIAMVDLRLLGWAQRARPFAALARELLPLAWTAFGFAAVSGALLFISKAHGYGHNIFFITKLALLAAAGLNVAYFHHAHARNSAQWGANVATTPWAARVAGGVSLLLWAGVVAVGRGIGFSTL
jgi:hypothetical protein